MVHKLRLRHYILLGFIIAFTVLCLKYYIDSKATHKEKSLDDITNISSVKFPPTSELLNYYEFGFGDYSLYVKVAIKNEDIENFLAEKPISDMAFYGPEKNIPKTVTEHKVKNWWKTSTVEKWRCSKTLKGTSLLRVLVDYDNEDVCIVYIIWGFD